MSGGAPVIVKANDPQEKILCIADLERVGSSKLTNVAREFFNSGSTDEQTIRENSSAFSKYRLRSRVLVDVSKCDTGTVLWGNKLWMPLGVSPAGAQGIAHADGELATARACARRNVPMGVSSFANFQVDEICAAGRAASQTFDAAMQIYTMRDRALMERVVRRAEDAGCRAVFLTGDSPVLGVRYNEWRNDFRVPSHLGFPNIEWTSERWRLQTHDQGFTGFNDNAHSWARDIPWLRKRTKMEIWIKGVLTAEDTRLAIESGCDGIIVSNHGGRQLDGVPASLDALVECVEAAKGSNLRIHVDGGFRRGSDVFIALALGAECCWVGRPTLWGLAYNGEKGVDRMLEIIQEEFRRCMCLCGCSSINDINRSCLARITADGFLARL